LIKVELVDKVGRYKKRKRKRNRKRNRKRRLGPDSVQSVGAAEAVSLAIGHNPGRVVTPIQENSKLALILPTSEG